MGRTVLIQIYSVFLGSIIFWMIQGKKDWKTVLLKYFLKIIAFISPKQIEDQISQMSEKILTCSEFW